MYKMCMNLKLIAVFLLFDKVVKIVHILIWLGITNVVIGVPLPSLRDRWLLWTLPNHGLPSG